VGDGVDASPFVWAWANFRSGPSIFSFIDAVFLGFLTGVPNKHGSPFLVAVHGTRLTFVDVRTSCGIIWAIAALEGDKGIAQVASACRTEASCQPIHHWNNAVGCYCHLALYLIK
jgi:hypothetical protein